MAAPRWLAVPAVALLAAGAGACGGGASRPSAAVLLGEARTTLDKAPAVHFTLTSSGVSGSGIDLVGGSGDIVRPSSLRGAFAVSTSGVQVSVKVISIGSRFWAVLPFQSRYTAVKPSQLGLTNPATLLSPETGVSGLLTDMAPHARYEPSVRLQGELLDVVAGTVPGTTVPVLPDANPSKPVALTVAVDPSTHQVRRVVLRGPFTSASATATYTVTLTGYGEHVTVTPPS
ncbi:MAG: LppX_LprAFG lipoprotein [Acidimicrobiales bacterium]